MPIEVGIWRLGDKADRVEFSEMPSEKRLEDILAEDISILDPNLLLIGRQVHTSFGKVVDILAMDADGKLVVIELKRDKTPRDVIAQLLDYGSWVRELKDEDIATIFDEYLRKYCSRDSVVSIDEAFCGRFGLNEMPESINDGHELVVVATELDDSTERIVNYLADEYGAAINAVYFRFFKDGDKEYITRVWLIDPGEADVKVVEKRGEEPWNGEFYVSFGEGATRKWYDARQYGYIAAGGGAWYSRTLDILEAGSRIWVNVPGRGYVGVGLVLEKAKPITEFTIPDSSGQELSIKEVVNNLPDPDKPAELLEYYVRVKWCHTVPLEEAVREKGFFGNQNSAARPKARKWTHTVERLKKRWRIEE
ncbi:MAG: endonuclease NucS domain-containing protein [Thermodesulfobacteriota bacterium]